MWLKVVQLGPIGQRLHWTVSPEIIVPWQSTEKGNLVEDSEREGDRKLVATSWSGWRQHASCCQSPNNTGKQATSVWESRELVPSWPHCPTGSGPGTQPHYLSLHTDTKFSPSRLHSPSPKTPQKRTLILDIDKAPDILKIRIGKSLSKVVGIITKINLEEERTKEK